MVRSLRFMGLIVVLCLALLAEKPAKAQDSLLPPVTVAVQLPSVPVTLPTGFVFGTYDPIGNLKSSPNIQAENIFLAWNDDPNKLVTSLNEICGRGHIAMISLEPRSWNGYNGLGDDTLLADIVGGWYNDVINAVGEIFKAYGDSCTILIRWGHEPEITGLFPWSKGDPAAYIAAFRYVATAIRDVIGATNVKFVWSPAGNKEAPLYYPGDDVVDYVGLTILGFSDWDIMNNPNKTWSSFNELTWPRYAMMSGFNKPIIIAELGVCCGNDHQARWLKDAYYTMQDQQWYPLIKMAFYFNDRNPDGVWHGLTPDWRICSALYPQASLQATARTQDPGQVTCPTEFTR